MKQNIEFIETPIELNLSEYDIEHWENDKITDDMIITLPENWVIVKSGRVKIGDLMYGYNYGWNKILTKETEGYHNYFGDDGVGTEVGHFLCVARKINF